MDKLYKILDGMGRAAERDNHNGLRAEREDLLSAVSRYGAWEDEGRRYGEPMPERPTLKDAYATLEYHGYRWNGNEVVKR